MTKTRPFSQSSKGGREADGFNFEHACWYGCERKLSGMRSSPLWAAFLHFFLLSRSATPLFWGSRIGGATSDGREDPRTGL